MDYIVFASIVLTIIIIISYVKEPLINRYIILE